MENTSIYYVIKSKLFTGVTMGMTVISMESKKIVNFIILFYVLVPIFYDKAKDVFSPYF